MWPGDTCSCCANHSFHFDQANAAPPESAVSHHDHHDRGRPSASHPLGTSCPGYVQACPGTVVRRPPCRRSLPCPRRPAGQREAIYRHSCDCSPTIRCPRGTSCNFCEWRQRGVAQRRSRGGARARRAAAAVTPQPAPSRPPAPPRPFSPRHHYPRRAPSSIGWCSFNPSRPGRELFTRRARGGAKGQRTRCSGQCGCLSNVEALF